MHRALLPPLAAGLILGLGAFAPADAAKTVFRITDMDLRDPHVYVSILGCRDATDTPFFGVSINPTLQDELQTDADGDSLLDSSYLLVFDPLDQAGSGGTLQFGTANCTAPLAGTTCMLDAVAQLNSYPYVNPPAQCLTTIPGSIVHVYAPAVGSTEAPCFVADLETVILTLGNDIPIVLTDAYLAATYVGTPAGNLVSGLIRGFIAETTANVILLPEALPIIGGLTLSELFPGGDPPGPSNINCAPWSDKEVGPGGELGWYVYFNFTAAEVTYTEPATPVGGNASASLSLAAPHPNPFNPSTRIRYLLPEAAHVRVTIYDAGGRMVTRLVDEVQGDGAHEVGWDGRDAHARAVSSGVYFVRLDANGESLARKVVLLK